MPWPTPEDILRRLPIATFEDAEGKLTAPDVQGYIDRWIGKLAQGAPAGTVPPETENGIDAVERGARADSLEQLYTGTGYDQVRAAEVIRREAYRSLETYKQEVSVPGESTYDASFAGSEYVENFTEEPLWPSGASESDGYRPSWVRELYG